MFTGFSLSRERFVEDRREFTVLALESSLRLKPRGEQPSFVDVNVMKFLLHQKSPSVKDQGTNFGCPKSRSYGGFAKQNVLLQASPITGGLPSC